MKARIQDGYVVEILAPIPGFTIDQCFHADLLDKCVDVGDLKVGDPWPPVAIEPTPVETVVTPEPAAEPAPTTKS